MKKYIVLHLEKAKGNDSQMSAHIERTVSPKNVDSSRSHLNCEYIFYPENVKNRTEAIQHRLENANLSRKIGSNQVRAIRAILSGSHEQMIELEKENKLQDWIDDSIEWLQDVFGKENVVSVIVHLDEKTPHLHATIIPIVSGERRKAKKESNQKKKYKTKDLFRNRLCADDIMNRQKLKFYQDSYSVKMEKYGLYRGVEGSAARHVSTSEYYTSIFKENEELEEQKKNLLSQKFELETDVKRLQSKKSFEKIKENVSNFVTGKKTRELLNEIAHLKTENSKLEELSISEKEHLNKSVATLSHNLSYQTSKSNIEISKLNEKVKAFYENIAFLSNMDPLLKDRIRIINECKFLQISDEKIEELFNLNSTLVSLKNSKKTYNKEEKFYPLRIEKNNTGELNAFIADISLTEFVERLVAKNRQFLKNKI